MAEKKKYHILNLYNDPLGDFQVLLQDEGHEIYVSEEFTAEKPCDVVVLNSYEEMAEVQEKYGLSPKDTEFILFEKVKSLKSFLQAGGRLASSQIEFSKAITDLSLKSRLQNNLSLHLNDYFEGEIHKFTIVNHLMTGTVVDEMAVYAYRNGFDLVSVRSVIDQMIYYLTYLKQAGFAGVPFECEYAIYEGQFIFRMSAMVKNFSMENIVDSFDDNNSMGQVRYLLSAITQSCQFFDVTLLEKPNKLIMTTFFDEDSKSRNWGIHFNNIPYASMIGAEEENKLYKDAKQRSRDLSQAAEELVGKNLNGGFDYFNFALDADSVLNSEGKSAENVIDYMLDLFQETYPELMPSDFTKEHFDELKSQYEDQDLMNSLSENDEDYLIEQVQKNHLAESYKAARSKIRDNEEVISALQNAMGDEVADRFAEEIDDDIINNVLALEDPLAPGVAPKQEQETIFGTFEPSVANIHAGGAFDEINAGFATPGAVNLDGLLDGLDLEADETQVPVFEEIADIDYSFGAEDFDDLLNDTVPGFAQNASDEVIRLSDSSVSEKFAETVKGLQEDAEDFIESFANGFDQNLDDENIKISGWAEDEGNFKMIVKSTVEKTAKLKSIEQSVKCFVEKEAPKKIQEKLKEKLEEEGIDFSDVSPDTLREFSRENLPQIMTDLLSDQSKVQEFKDELEDKFNPNQNTELEHLQISEFQRKFKERLEKKIEYEIDLVEVNGVMQIPGDELKSEKRQEIVKETMREVFAEEFAFDNASPTEILMKENRLIDELSVTLTMDRAKVEKIVKGAAAKAKELELQKVSEYFEEEAHWESAGDGGESDSGDMEVKSLADPELMKKFERLEEENKDLKTEISTLQLRLSTTEDVKDQFDDVMSGVAATNDEVKDAAEEDFMKLDRSLEKEAELRDALKDTITELKKAELEIQKRNIVFKKELGKAKKAVKAKDLVLEKAKESIKNAMKKKEKQIFALKTHVAELEERNENSEAEEDKPKMLRRDDTEVIQAEEIKNLKKSKETLEKRIDSEIDAHEETQEKLQEAAQFAQEAKSKLLTMETELKTANSQLQLLKDQNSNLLQTADAGNAIKAEKLGKENDLLKQQIDTLQSKLNDEAMKSANAPSPLDMEKMQAKNQQLNSKVKELIEKLKKAEKANVATAMGGGTAKEKHLDKNLKKVSAEATKLRSDFAEKKKEALKYKTELTGLKNKMSAMKRDLDRANKQLARARNGKKAA